MITLTPYEFLAPYGIIITDDNESDECDQTWSMMHDFMIQYALREMEPLQQQIAELQRQLTELKNAK